MAKLADAHGSGPCARKGMGVQVPPRALMCCLGSSFIADSGYRSLFALLREGVLWFLGKIAGDLSSLPLVGRSFWFAGRQNSFCAAGSRETPNDARAFARRKATTRTDTVNGSAQTVPRWGQRYKIP